MSSLKAFTVLIVMGLSWGVTIPLSKIAVSTGHHPLGLIVWQFAIAIIILACICFVKRIKISLNWLQLKFFAAIAIFGTIVPNSFSYYSAAQLPAGVMAIIIASVPMFSLIITLLLGLEKFSLFRTLGVVLGITAIGLIVSPDTSLPDPEKAVFVLIALIAPFSYGIESNYIELKKIESYDPIATIFGASIVGFIMVIPMTVGMGGWVDLFADIGKAELALIVSSVIHTLVYIGYVWTVNASGAVFATQVSYIVTISGVLFSAIFLNESYSSWIWAALLLMMCGLLLVQPKKTPEQLVNQQ